MARSALIGAREMREQLAQLETALATRIGRKAVRTAARELQAALIAEAPRGPGKPKGYTPAAGGTTRYTDYGHLYQNIRVRAVRARKQGHIVYEVTTGRGFWGYFREFGTVNQPARPWMRPVIDRMGNRLLGVMADTAWADIAKQVKKGGGAMPRERAIDTDDDAGARMRAFVRGDSDSFTGD